jgi:hypothetical protein
MGQVKNELMQYASLTMILELIVDNSRFYKQEYFINEDAQCHNLCLTWHIPFSYPDSVLFILCVLQNLLPG